jgi:hypothetical protein
MTTQNHENYVDTVKCILQYLRSFRDFEWLYDCILRLTILFSIGVLDVDQELFFSILRYCISYICVYDISIYVYSYVYMYKYMYFSFTILFSNDVHQELVHVSTEYKI